MLSSAFIGIRFAALATPVVAAYVTDFARTVIHYKIASKLGNASVAARLQYAL